jgi:transcriptional regulator with XRE-family HTH domain
VAHPPQLPDAADDVPPEPVGAGTALLPHVPFRPPFAQYLRRWRRTRELSQQQAAELIGYSRNYWTRLESGDRPPTRGFLERLAVHAGLSARALADVASWALEPETVAPAGTDVERAPRERPRSPDPAPTYPPYPGYPAYPPPPAPFPPYPAYPAYPRYPDAPPNGHPHNGRRPRRRPRPPKRPSGLRAVSPSC